MKTINKRVIFILPMLSAMAIYGQESGFGYGGILGIGQANIKSNGLTSPMPKIAFTAGATTSYKFNKYLGLTLDITGVTKGAKATGSEKAGFPSQTYKYNENYSFLDLDIPVMLKAYIGSDKLNLNLMGGAGMNFNLLAVSTRQYDDANYNNDHGYNGKQLAGINPTNYSYTFGVGVTVKSRQDYYFINLRTTGPLGSFGNINGSSATHNNFNITFGYLFY